MNTKNAASFHMSKHLKGRSGRRPIRIEKLLAKERAHSEKIGSESGVDLRVPIMGGTKFPTADSTAHAAQLLHTSQKASAFHKPAPVTLKDVTPEIKAPKAMPKVGSDMTLHNDPLIQYLKKTAEVLEDNIDEMALKEKEEPTTREEVIPDIEPNETAWRKYINGVFDNGESMRRKDTSYAYDEGVVDRILKL